MGGHIRVESQKERAQPFALVTSRSAVPRSTPELCALASRRLRYWIWSCRSAPRVGRSLGGFWNVKQTPSGASMQDHHMKCRQLPRNEPTGHAAVNIVEPTMPKRDPRAGRRATISRFFVIAATSEMSFCNLCCTEPTESITSVHTRGSDACPPGRGVQRVVGTHSHW
jgi:hypothetical protein